MSDDRKLLDLTVSEFWASQPVRPVAVSGEGRLVADVQPGGAKPLVPGVDFQTALGLVQFAEGSLERLVFTDLPNAVLLPLSRSHPDTVFNKR